MNYPKIGIRPTIDGRQGGVRESLEDQVMAMAQAAASFIENSIKYPDGKNVECVIADTTIGGVAEAAACAEKFRNENVGVSLTVTPCWCYGSETIDMDPQIPKAVWGFNDTERPGAVYLAAALAGHNQKGIPAFGIYGKDVQDADDTTIPDDVKEKIVRFVKAGLATAIMRGKSYLSMGSVSMGIAGSIVNEDFFQAYPGMRNEYMDITKFLRRLEQEIYETRHQIENMIDVFKNIFKADKSYMQNNDAIEGWMFINFIVMHWYYQILRMLQVLKLNNKYSPKDIILFLSNVKKVKINNKWYDSELTKNEKELFDKLKILIV